MKLLTWRKLHRWVALFVGVQLLLWTTSGLVFAWLDHHAVAGDGLAEAPRPAVLTAETVVLDPSELQHTLGWASVEGIALRSVAGRWVYRVQSPAGVQLRLARDGSPFAIDAATARTLASSHYRGEGRLRAVTLHDGPTSETRDAGPTWQASFDDAAGTSLYFAADDGALVAVRTDAWRLKDFFWMLHTMDYRGRDDFNNPLVVLAGGAALWVALSGLWLLVRVFRPRTGGPPP